MITPVNEKNAKTLVINELTREIKEREEEASRLKAMVQKIAAIEGEITTLRSSLSLLQGNVEAGAVKPQAHLFNNGASNGAQSLPSIAYRILKQANRPLGASELVSMALIDGDEINYHSLTSMMSAKIKNGSQFYREGSGKDGKYGLLEWKRAAIEESDKD